MTETFVKIPQPAPRPFVGNLFDIDVRGPVQSMMKLAEAHGEIFKLEMIGRSAVVVSSAALVDEVCDKRRFDKSLKGILGRVRRFTGDGLFTAATGEPNWRRAHNILLPNFNQNAIRGYHPMMLDVAEQLMLKLERMNKGEVCDVAHDMTSLTLDTIGLCGFGYRFNSFYRERYHPFIDAMVGALDATMKTRSVPFERLLRWRRERKLAADIALLNALVDEIIRERKQSGDDHSAHPDLLSSMLSGVDKASGEQLDDINIRYQIITFLIAGHETTSGLLSFTIYYLLNNPEILRNCTAEVDRVLGTDSPSYSQVTQLTLINRVLKETLRLWPTAPGFGLIPLEDTVLAGRFALAKGQHIFVLLPKLHRDPAVWGPDPERFDPDRFTREAERGRPANSYKPFGNGHRACIGQQFAMHEAALVIGMLLQRFTLIGDPGYRLKIKETLTIKPDGLTIRVRRRS